MTQAFVLMTAMPPTLGHLDLIKFAHALTGNVTVIVCTQPGEPYTYERAASISEATRGLSGVRVERIHKTLPQEPEGNEGFWDMWTDFLWMFGFQDGDCIVASEQYGKTLAEKAGGVFVPYDLDRSIRHIKATYVRNNPRVLFQNMIPEFRKHLKRTITIFGAESVGKTTVSKYLARSLYGLYLFEWARPYLESVGPEITIEKMNVIQAGQSTLQRLGQRNYEHEFVIQDTDLFSTVGYWELWDKANMPKNLIPQAQSLKSDLYIILPSDIPFEPDPLRYGGDKRESTDQYWIDLCEREGLNYVYPTEWTGPRAYDVEDLIVDRYPGTYLNYQRKGKEYESA